MKNRTTYVLTALFAASVLVVAPNALAKDKVKKSGAKKPAKTEQVEAPPPKPEVEPEKAPSGTGADREGSEKSDKTLVAAAVREPEGMDEEEPPRPKKKRAKEKVESVPEEDDDEDGIADSGLSLGLRAGYALPMGSVAKDPRLGSQTDLSKYASGMAPLWLDVGYRITPNWYVGGYFSFALLSTSGDFCKSRAGANAACSSSGNDIRFGAAARYTFRPKTKVAPWVGLSTGYEITNISASANGRTLDGTAKGWEFVGAHFGVDVRVAREITVGPMINASIGQYTSDTWSNQNGSTSADYNNTALHQWIFLGLRGNYDL